MIDVRAALACLQLNQRVPAGWDILQTCFTMP